ncbi:hypothetical protein LshimejAT787_0504950 [Lyophyllum shimeji]|uniref:Uncharacterized protein n=1 Tax=Lyophyllum shimeji TaxID=47721 RepID=A0A9P3PMI2_LYOSH|nr:hypothetical protein LshimejAT787_0504950 [Lyophyllum shimeji]
MGPMQYTALLTPELKNFTRHGLEFGNKRLDRIGICNLRNFSEEWCTLWPVSRCWGAARISGHVRARPHRSQVPAMKGSSDDPSDLNSRVPLRPGASTSQNSAQDGHPGQDSTSLEAKVRLGERHRYLGNLLARVAPPVIRLKWSLGRRLSTSPRPETVSKTRHYETEFPMSVRSILAVSWASSESTHFLPFEFGSIHETALRSFGMLRTTQIANSTFPRSLAMN